MAKRPRRARTDGAPAPALFPRLPRIWDAITLLPSPLPEIDWEETDTSVQLLGRTFALPLLLEFPSIPPIDEARARIQIAVAAHQYRIPASIGNLHPVFDQPSRAVEFKSARDVAPDSFLLGEIGSETLLDLRRDDTIDTARVREVVTATGVDGLIVHLDFPELAVAQDRRPSAAGCLEAIAELNRRLRIPILARSTPGIPRWSGRRLSERGVVALIVGGAETFGQRIVAPAATNRMGSEGDDLGETFVTWGIPTLAAIRMLRSVGPAVISNGLIRSGLDSAKAIALGAQLVATTPPLADEPGEQGKGVREWLDRFTRELRTAMFLGGAQQLDNLRQVPFLATGETREWLEAAEALWRSDRGNF